MPTILRFRGLRVVTEGLSRRELALALVGIDRREIHGDA